MWEKKEMWMLSKNVKCDVIVAVLVVTNVHMFSLLRYLHEKKGPVWQGRPALCPLRPLPLPLPQGGVCQGRQPADCPQWADAQGLLAGGFLREMIDLFKSLFLFEIITLSQFSCLASSIDFFTEENPNWK